MGLVNKKLVKKWIHALESGEYVQGRSCMRSTSATGPDEFCCLGVLCDTIDPKKWDKTFPERFTWNESGCALPPKPVMDSVGLSDKALNAVGLDVWAFVNANDGKMSDLGTFSFAEIAEILRMKHNIWN